MSTGLERVSPVNISVNYITKSGIVDSNIAKDDIITNNNPYREQSLFDNTNNPKYTPKPGIKCNKSTGYDINNGDESIYEILDFHFKQNIMIII